MLPGPSYSSGNQPYTYGSTDTSSFPITGTQGQPFLPQPTQAQDPLHQGGDPSSPELFKQNIRNIRAQVDELQAIAQRALSGIQNAYQRGNSAAHTEAEIGNLHQMLQLVIQLMRQTGVGALPVLLESQSAPSEEQLLASTNTGLHDLYEKLKRSQDSAQVAANLLSSDQISRTTSAR